MIDDCSKLLLLSAFGDLAHEILSDVDYTVEGVTTDVATFVERNKLHCDDFVYDFKSGIIFYGISHHVWLMESLYYHYTQVPRVVNGKFQGKWDAADNYVADGHGIFKSKVGNMIYKSADVAIPTEFTPLSWRFDDL